MATVTEGFLPTRKSLLDRLKDLDDQESWRDFVNRYSNLIYQVAVKAGLSDAEAQDVVQDTVCIVTRKMPGFDYDPKRGSFKSWLLLITRRRIEKQIKKRLPVQPPSNRADETQRTSTLERQPDPAGCELEKIWENEWTGHLRSLALTRIKNRVKAKQYQMFDLYVVKGWPVREVADALGVSVATVYMNKHRISKLLQKEIQDLSE